jgi:hypothetical protein
MISNHSTNLNNGGHSSDFNQLPVKSPKFRQTPNHDVKIGLSGKLRSHVGSASRSTPSICVCLNNLIRLLVAVIRLMSLF